MLAGIRSRCHPHSSRPAIARWRSGAGAWAALNGIGRRAELVGGHVAHGRGLAGGIGGHASGPAQVPGRRICMAGRNPGLRPRDRTAHPGTPEVDRAPRTVVVRTCLLEVVQHVLGTLGRPQCKETMIGVLERPAATHRDEPRIPNPGEDHPTAPSVPAGRRIGVR